MVRSLLGGLLLFAGWGAVQFLAETEVSAVPHSLLENQKDLRPSARTDSLLSPGAVLAAFESSLTAIGGRFSSLGDRAALQRARPELGQNSPRPMELAAVIGEDISAIFKTNAAGPLQQALTGTLSVTPEALSVSGPLGAPTTRHTLQIRSLGDTVSWTATAILLNGTGWLVASPPSGTATANQPSTLNVDVNYGALPTAGVYQATITVRDPSGGFSVGVPVALFLSPSQGRLLLSQNAFVFRAAQGGTAPPNQTLRVINVGQGSINWSIPPSLGAPFNWLDVTPLSGVAVAGSPQGSPTTLRANPSGLASGVYQALIPVSAPGAANNPQVALVTFEVAPAGTPAGGELSPNGMLFVAQQGGSAPSPQNLIVSNGGAGTLTFQLQPSTSSGGSWLAVSAGSGSTTSGPVTVQVSVTSAGLPAGVYRGKVTVTFSSGGPQDLEVLLVVASSTAALRRVLPGGAACTAQAMDLVATTIGNGVSVPISFPRPLLALVVDTCGVVVNNANVVAGVEGLNIVLQPLGDGFYSGTWVPQSEASSLVISFTGLHPTFPPVQRSYTVSATLSASGVILPTIAPDGVVEGAGFTALRPLAPGGIISIFGSRLASAEAFASAVPLPRELGGVSVRMGGENAPLYYVGPGQINAQAPYSLRPGDSAPVVVTTAGRLTAPQNYLIAAGQPGVFVAGDFAAVLDGQSRLITVENPARIGDTLQIFTTGLGATNPAAETGAAAPPFSTVLNPVTVTIGGVEVPVVYQGLAPGFVGLYQVNVVLPASVAPAIDVPLVVKQNGIPSNPNLPAYIPVRSP